MIEKDIQLEVTYFTDPLCCWSWAFEQHWNRLKEELGENISYRYRMAGLIKDWISYDDPINSISRPAQMGPLWMEAAVISGVPINTGIWITSPPKSSYPSCIAFKAAELQSSQAAEIYLRCLREAVMVKSLDISSPNILLDIAAETENQNPEIFNFKIFETTLSGASARNAFKEDLQLIRLNNITRFPSITFSKPGENGIGITGYRPYEEILKAIKFIVPEFNLK